MASDEIKSLIDVLRRGQYEDPTEKIAALTAALLEEGAAEVALLLTLLRAPQIPLRLAAMNAVADCRDPQLLVELFSISIHAETRLRVQLAEILANHNEEGAITTLRTLLKDKDSLVRSAALKSSQGRAAFLDLQKGALAHDTDWGVRNAAVNALEAQPTLTIIPALFEALARDTDDDVRRRCAEIIEQRFAESASATEAQFPRDISLLTKAEKYLLSEGAERFAKLAAWIASQTNTSVDPEVLAKYGTDLTMQALSGTLPRAHAVEEICQTVLRLVQRRPWRSIALLGPSGSGKSALLNQLVYELAKTENGGWRVLRISPTDFMAGTRYVGEWETKVHELVSAIRHPRRVLIYVPNLSDLAAAGTWSKSESSVATALAPYLEDGSVLVIGETSPEQYERGIGRVPSLQRLFDKVLLTEPSVETTRNIVTAVRDEAASSLSDDGLDQLLEVSGQFLSHISRPGSAVMLLRDVLAEEREMKRPMTFRDVLNALSKSTGIPADLLDDAIPLQLPEVREFFERRIIGQPEAIDAVVDLVTLIKAGVTDPQKPFGVFLFLGPTGVGKTELARSLAEFIFGDSARLKRFDMSEFASSDGFVRLIGAPQENGVLTDAVRQHPFSVVLLDEIEKSHLNVFDLCLQIFDAGRLTDGRGRTVDFRRTIVILTSNIGASVGTTPLGFGSSGTPVLEVDKDRTLRELTRFFRPEFLNRLDRIVEFRPLTLQVAEQIARREIDLVLQRSGIRRRRLAIDIDPAVVSLLVREGYSPHFGARPLKRVVERRLLLPLARVISGGSLRAPAMLRLTEHQGQVTASVIQVTPDPETTVAPEHEPIAPSRRIDDLLIAHATLDQAVQTLAHRKSELISRTSQTGFFDNPSERSATFDEIHKLDQYLGQCSGLGKALHGFRDRLERRPPSEIEARANEDRLDQFADELEHLTNIAACQNVTDLSDVLLSLVLVDRTGQAQNAVSKLTAMYQGLAQRNRMTAEILGEFYDEQRDRVYLGISGLGAYGLLKSEGGLHQMDRRYKERTPRAGREAIREDREIVRVEAHAMTSEPPESLSQEVRIKISALKPPQTRLLTKADLSVAIFDEKALRSADFWTCGPKNQALARSLLIAHAQRATPALLNTGQEMVRHYDVGLAAKVKDHHTGRSTTRVDRVLKGDLAALQARRS